MTPAPRRTARIELLPDHPVTGPDGQPTTDVEAEFAITGGYLELRVPGTGTVQIVSAPAVRRITHPDAS
ncbi:hypothetical protein [Yinghuangia soli]|uniref:Uncharacterized protein n=1 Tax=Yinghuangia soli TaxID=2908204 RepID=A0AA41Q8M8_9ACTN|nr:hypothetical protein [Yinghuangia soli]MCF2533246.1 hypothetical protein [Yinghuangia soli]